MSGEHVCKNQTWRIPAKSPVSRAAVGRHGDTIAGRASTWEVGDDLSSACVSFSALRCFSQAISKGSPFFYPCVGKRRERPVLITPVLLVSFFFHGWVLESHPKSGQRRIDLAFLGEKYACGNRHHAWEEGRYPLIGLPKAQKHRVWVINLTLSQGSRKRILEKR